MSWKSTRLKHGEVMAEGFIMMGQREYGVFLVKKLEKCAGCFQILEVLLFPPRHLIVYQIWAFELSPAGGPAGHPGCTFILSLLSS